MTKRLLIILGILAAISGLVVIVASQNGRNAFLAEADYGDGKHKLRLLKVAVGPLDYEWNDPLYSFPFARLLMPGRRFIPPISIHTDGLAGPDQFPGTTFLFRAVDLNERYAMPVGIHPQIQFVESTGFVFEEFGEFNHSVWGAMTVTKSALPRRDKLLTIRLVDRDQKSVISEMQVPNPNYKPDYPEWEPELLPVSKAVDGVSCTLKELKVWEGAKRTHFDYELDFTRPDWKAGAASGQIYAETFLEDATGNIGQWLSPFEKAWKAVILVSPPITAEFAAADSARLKQIPVPAYGKVHVINQKVTIQGHELHVRCISGGGKVRESRGVWSGEADEKNSGGVSVSSGSSNGMSFREISQNEPFVWIEHDRLPHGLRPFARPSVGGQPLAGKYTGDTSIGDQRILCSPINVPAGTTEIDLEIVISRALEFEFLVAPPAELREAVLKSNSGSGQGENDL